MRELRDKFVMVVHDSESARRRLTKLLQLWGCRTDSAASAGSALRRLRQQRPDAVICAEVLPSMDGATLRRDVRIIPGRASLPFVFVASAATDDENARFVITRRGARQLASRIISKMHMPCPVARASSPPSGMWKNVLAARYADVDPDSELESASQALILSV